MNIKYFVIIVVSFFAVWGCVSPPEYAIEPEIKFLSLSRDTIDAFDSLKITIEFTDGDGDLGIDDPQGNCTACPDNADACLEHPTVNLFIKDSRDGCTNGAHIPKIIPKGTTDAISGEISFLPFSSPCKNGISPLEGPPYDTVYYLIKIRDRAGNVSNEITTPMIIVRCNR